MKVNPVLDKTADVLMGLGLCGLLYKILTNQMPNNIINKLITTYNTSKMWRGIF